MQLKWSFFYYEKDGERKGGHASISEPVQRDGDWYTTVSCDRDKDREICGVDREQAIHLAKRLLPSHYPRFELENKDGSPFNWG